MGLIISTFKQNENTHFDYNIFFLAILIFCLLNTNAWPMGEEHFGNKPLGDGNYTAWPGILPLINDENRVYATWVNGNEFFYYRGDTEAFNQFLARFAAFQSPVHEVILRPGPGHTQSFHSDRPIPIGWQLHLVGGIVAQMVDYEGTADVWDTHPTLTVYLTETGRIQLDKIVLPENVKVVQVTDQRDKYRKALQSGNTRIQAQAATNLADEDPFTPENIPLIAQVLKADDPHARACAAVALGRCGALAKSALPALQEAARSDDQQASTCARKSIEKIMGSPDLSDDSKAFHAMEERIRKFTSALPPSNQQQ